MTTADVTADALKGVVAAGVAEHDAAKTAAREAKKAAKADRKAKEADDEKRMTEIAMRALKGSPANGVNPKDRPGGGKDAPNVSLNKPVRISLSKMIRSIGAGTYQGAELERDFAQAVQGIILRDDHESGVAFALPSTRSAFMKVIDEANINVGQPKRLHEWASRAAETEAIALAFLIKGDVQGAQQAMRDANEGSAAAGLALVPPEFMQQLYTLSIQTSVAFANAPGVTRIPVNSNLIYFPRETVMPTSANYAEAATITPSDATFGQQTITIKKQAAYNQFSNELLADSTPEYEVVIGKSLARSLGLRQDYEYLLGDGTGSHVLGLGSYTGLTTGYTPGTNGDAWGQPWNASYPAGTDFPLKMLGLARAAGWEPNAMIAHPNVMSLGLARATDANGRYLLESIGGVYGAPVPVPNIGALPTQITYQTPPWKAMLLGMPFLMTAQIPQTVTVGSKSDTGTVFMGDFNFAHILERQAIELARADQILFTTDQVAVRVTARTAIVLLAPAAFMKQTGVRGATDNA